MNILLDKLDFNESWAYETFKEIIKPEHKLCVIPFAFAEAWIKDKDEWEKCYNKLDGLYYKDTVSVFYTYGIEDRNITLLNYFEDSPETAKAKVRESDILLFTGGFPDKMMNRLVELGLAETIEQHKGIKMGWSAGAMMQCLEYYISPDGEDYKEFVYEKGLNCINDFAVEVHYKNEQWQNSSIDKFMREKGKPVYTTDRQSAIIVDGDNVTLLGNAKAYEASR